MTTATTYPHLTFDLDGTARIAGSRYKVQHLAAEHFHYGWTAEDLLRQHPDLRPEEVYASLAYFYDHFDEMTKSLTESAERASVAAARAVQPLSRQELLARVAAKDASIAVVPNPEVHVAVDSHSRIQREVKELQFEA